VKREDGFLVSFMFADYLLIDQEAIQQNEGTVGSGKAEP